MKMTNKQYKEYLKEKDPKSPVVKNTVLAFLVGGAICAVGQGAKLAFTELGVNEEHVKMAMPMALILLAAIFTALGLYDKLAKHAGAGTLVPITGFSNAIVAPAMEFKSEGLVMGMSARMFIVAGPVLVYGIAVSVVYGLVLYIVG
ncbi:MAG: stage V sporulation protein AC [Oscillospiraceae bacterium]|nr:stage V sporulation protein AC [Oscillospiraceae bacterium]